MKNPKAVAKKIYEEQGGDPPKSDGGYQVHCPCHDDKNPSLSVTPKGTTVLVHCHAGCESEDIIEYFRSKGIWPKGKSNNPFENYQLTNIYNYPNKNGEKFHRILKYTNKVDKDAKPKYSQQILNKDGKWIKGLHKKKPVLYKLPQIIKAVKEGKTIFICEGEKDADTVRKMGFHATTNPMGASKWRQNYTETLKGAEIVICPDNDEAGREHVSTVLRALYRHVKSIKVLKFKGLAEGEDVSDWVEKDGTADEFNKLQKETPFEPEPEKIDYSDLVDKPGSGRIGIQDFDNAASFYGTYGNSLHHRHDLGWVFWDKARWIKDTEHERYKYGMETLTTLENECNEDRDPDDDPIKLRSRKRLMAMIEVSKAYFSKSPNEFDSPRRCKYLLNLKDGTIDLRTGELHPHNRANLITKLIPVKYKKDAECPMFSDWLDLITDNNEELRRYLLQAAGYNLIGEAGERNIFVLYGDGNNGKTTFLSVLFWLMGGPQGDYASTIDTLTITKTYYDHIPTDLASLKGIRFAYCSEKLKQKELDIEMLKYMCGGEATLRARKMRQDYFNFEPVFKLWIMTNEKPFIDPDSKAIWNRLKIIPFIVDIMEKKKDIPLYWKKLLKAEGAGILNLILKGCRDYLENGLIEIQTVKKATDQFRESLDEVQPILDEYYDIKENYQSIEPDEVNAGNIQKYWYEQSSHIYKVWKKIRMAEVDEKDLISLKAFCAVMDRKKFQKTTRLTGGKTYILGIRRKKSMPSSLYDI